MNAEEDSLILALETEYWKQEIDNPEREAIKQRLLSINMPKEKYYLWDFCIGYGWRNIGNISGYKTLEELKNDQGHKFNVERKTPMIILQGKVCETFGVGDDIKI